MFVSLKFSENPLTHRPHRIERSAHLSVYWKSERHLGSDQTDEPSVCFPSVLRMAVHGVASTTEPLSEYFASLKKKEKHKTQ